VICAPDKHSFDETKRFYLLDSPYEYQDVNPLPRDFHYEWLPVEICVVCGMIRAKVDHS
jgi:hypothetical protein